MQAFNPYLSSWEYIPDGEPHVFGGRVYVYGSHDHFNAPIFCVGDYVCWFEKPDFAETCDWLWYMLIHPGNTSPEGCEKQLLFLFWINAFVYGVTLCFVISIFSCFMTRRRISVHAWLPLSALWWSSAIPQGHTCH